VTKTAYEIALNEFRDASADVRLAFGAVAETREKQILANRAHTGASEWHARAVARLDAADKALRDVETAAPTPADIDVGAKSAPEPPPPIDYTAGATPRVNGSLQADPAELGMG
jgi:hypothetical protein